MGYNKNKLYKTFDYSSADKLIFNFSENGLGLISLPHFVYNFSRLMFLMLYSVNWSIFNVWLFFVLEMLDNQVLQHLKFCSWDVGQPGCDVIKFEANLIFLVKPLWHMTKKSRQKFKYLENEKSFLGEIESIFHPF